MDYIPIVLFTLAYLGIPLAAAVWALVMLYRLRKDQVAIRMSLERLERRFQ